MSSRVSRHVAPFIIRLRAHFDPDPSLPRFPTVPNLRGWSPTAFRPRPFPRLVRHLRRPANSTTIAMGGRYAVDWNDPAACTEIRYLQFQQQCVCVEMNGGIHRNVDCFRQTKQSGDDCHETVEAQLSYLSDTGFAIPGILWQQELWSVFHGQRHVHVVRLIRSRTTRPMSTLTAAYSFV